MGNQKQYLMDSWSFLPFGCLHSRWSTCHHFFFLLYFVLWTFLIANVKFFIIHLFSYSRYYQGVVSSVVEYALPIDGSLLWLLPPAGIYWDLCWTAVSSCAMSAHPLIAVFVPMSVGHLLEQKWHFKLSHPSDLSSGALTNDKSWSAICPFCDINDDSANFNFFLF